MSKAKENIEMKWISIKDRLPNAEEMKRADNGGGMSNFLVTIEEYSEPYELCLTKDKRWVNSYMDEYNIVAWMNLPDAYEPKNDCKNLWNIDGWYDTAERMPTKEERKEYHDKFIVMIEGASFPTVLYIDNGNVWRDANGRKYSVVAWRLLPKVYSPATDDVEKAKESVMNCDADIMMHLNERLKINVTEEWVSAAMRLPNAEERLRSYYCETYGSSYITTVKDIKEPVQLYLTDENKWIDDNKKEYNVIAWKNMPTTYDKNTNCLTTKWYKNNVPNYEDMKRYNGRFIVIIKGALVPTVLSYNHENKQWLDMNRNPYIISGWMHLPDPYVENPVLVHKKEDGLRLDGKGKKEKAILVIDMPERCGVCPFFGIKCKLTGERTYYDYPGRRTDCPLNAFPERKPETRPDPNYCADPHKGLDVAKDFYGNQGYNECLDEIESMRKELY